MKLFFLLLFFCLACTRSNAQQQALSLSKQQMYADFDTLVTKIKTLSPQVAIKKDLWHYDALAEMSLQRKQIDTISSDFSFYLLIRRVLNASQDEHTSYQDFYPDEMRRIESAFRMYLPVAYLNGNYIIREPFSAGNDTVYTGTVITNINGLPVDDYIRQHLADRYYSYDLARKKFYSAGFFKNLATLFQDEVTFSFQDTKGLVKTITLKTHAHFNYLNHTHTTPDTTKIAYWPDQRALYIRLTAMDRQLIPYLYRELEKYRHPPLRPERIILDIRENGGGEDTVWQSLYARIIAKPVQFRLKIDDYSAARAIHKETNPLLARYGLYTILDTTETLDPDSNSIRFAGKIIVLAEHIYSSAGSSMVVPNADPHDHIYAIGRKTGFFLGVGFSPLNFELPYSKMTCRIAPSLNVTGVKKLADLMHDDNEIELPMTLQELIDLQAHPGNRFGKDFLIRYDPFVRKALAL
ncbi:MAG: S41 family peptidase [Bacteroidota bacterium]